jgi:hypothetical protein
VDELEAKINSLMAKIDEQGREINGMRSTHDDEKKIDPMQ